MKNKKTRLSFRSTFLLAQDALENNSSSKSSSDSSNGDERHLSPIKRRKAVRVLPPDREPNAIFTRAEKLLILNLYETYKGNKVKQPCDQVAADLRVPVISVKRIVADWNVRKELQDSSRGNSDNHRCK